MELFFFPLQPFVSAIACVAAPAIWRQLNILAEPACAAAPPRQVLAPSLVASGFANHEGPRLSAAYFFSTSLAPSTKLYGPNNESISEDNPLKYRETTVLEYVSDAYAKALDIKFNHFSLYLNDKIQSWLE
ncbi:1-aminocyclopropane-1-carboxylate oxidase homolog 1-like [Olea europaea subsp. europaea]|uniref:1-aminocyclopropane-1-carboxylate oxidase homolog 1-like n=1 Tax=Olea europaea subsp. europaea TaxID=158383 RepID=A0A8S0S7W6_OLEEU|nr:1-aminocyclopropane-1-carboxylate oxidase homolog 1-like [Olea europaea subsp. europaea]